MISQTTKRGRGLFWFAVSTASVAYLAVIAGAIATSSRSPSLSERSILEWTKLYDLHRLTAYLAAGLTLALAGALFVKEKRRWMKVLGGVAALAVILQAALGLLEARRLHFALAISHSCLAQVYFCLIVSLAIFSYPKWRWEALKGAENKLGRELAVRPVALGFSIVVFAQIALGAFYRDEAQSASGGIRGFGVLPHIVGGGVVLAASLWLLIRVLNLPARDTGLMVLTVSLAIFVMVQVFLGIGVYMMMRFSENAPRTVAAGGSSFGSPILPIVIASVMHVSLGTLILAGSVAAVYLAYRRAAPLYVSGGSASALSLTRSL